MTCDEARIMMDREPEDLTNAEAGALMGHLRDCDTCLEWEAIRKADSGPPDEERVRTFLNRIVNDPEADPRT